MSLSSSFNKNEIYEITFAETIPLQTSGAGETGKKPSVAPKERNFFQEKYVQVVLKVNNNKE